MTVLMFAKTRSSCITSILTRVDKCYISVIKGVSAALMV